MHYILAALLAPLPVTFIFTATLPTYHANIVVVSNALLIPFYHRAAELAERRLNVYPTFTVKALS
jgi:hypothetical protein